MMNCKHGQFEPTEYADFVENTGEMVLYGVFADSVRYRNVAVALPVHDRSYNFAFSDR